MGTRSTTKIYQKWHNGKKENILNLYKQFDGHTDSWGKDLKDFIKSGTFVNGLRAEKGTYFNGAGCFALQLVKKFKEGAGGLYATFENDEQEYNYTILVNYLKDGAHRITITCKEEKDFREVFLGGEVIENGPRT